MLKRTWQVLVLVLAVVMIFPIVALAAGGPPTGRGQGSSAGSLVAGDALSAAQESTLISWWTDEHNALATYQAIMAQFGNVAPFASIARAEQSHIVALERIFARYGVDVPAVPTVAVPTFETLEDACAAAAQAEIDNAALYDEFMAQFTQSDILRVANNLRSVSLNNHLPAFEACADGAYVPGTTGTGTGAGARGQGQATLSGRGFSSRGNAQAPRGSGDPLSCPVAQP